MDFTDILSRYGIAYYTEGKNSRPGWIQLDCPWCGVPGKPGLGYNIRGGYLNCYKCGGHSAVSFLHHVTKEPFDKLKKLIGNRTFDHDTERTHTGRLKLPIGLGPLQKAHVRYLEKRGFSVDEILETWHIQALGQVGYIQAGDRRIDLTWRIFIPIIWRGEMVSWTTRSIDPEGSRRYVAAPSECESIPHKSILYGADYCVHAACAIEGQLDVWAFGKGGVGLSGVGFQMAQVRHLAKYMVRGVWMDNEPEAQIRAKELVDCLYAFPGDVVNFESQSGKDASRSTRGEINQARHALGLPTR